MRINRRYFLKSCAALVALYYLPAYGLSNNKVEHALFGTLPKPDKIQRVISAGPPSDLLLFALVPEKMVGFSSINLQKGHSDLFAAQWRNLPIYGRLVGRGSTLSLEKLLDYNPDLIIDTGNIDETYRSEAEKVAKQTGIAYLSLILVGVAISALCGSAISLMKILADPYTQLPSITFWLLGGLSSITQSDPLSALPIPIMLIGIIPLLRLRWRMNLLSLSDEEAKSLGINVNLIRAIFIVSATLITASAVSIAGIIGWIGLIVPHITQMIVSANFHYQLPASMAIGAIMLLITDTLARSIAAIELPLGILTSAVGAPFFLAILLLTRRVK